MKDNTRRIILTADDFGASEFINKGVFQGIDKGLINSVSAMVNFPESEEALKELAAKHPEVSIGLHVTITAGNPLSPPEEIPSLVDDKGRFYNFQEFLKRITNIERKEVLQETRLQIKKMEEWGIKNEHLSSHHNVLQVHSPLFRILLHLASDKKLGVRSTRPLSRFIDGFGNSPTVQEGRKAALTLVGSHQIAAVKFMKYGTNKEMNKNHKMINRRRLPHADYLGDNFWGNPTPANIRHTLENLPEGSTELIFHLGSPSGTIKAPRGIDEGYYPFRELELFCVTSAEFPRWLERYDIQRVNYRDL